MSGNRARNGTAAIEGCLLWLSEAREIAIYQRDGVAWIADFRGARAELFTVGEWFALNGGGSPLRRAEPASPLPPRMVERIERLHAADDRARLLSGLLDRLAGFCRELVPETNETRMASR